MRIAQKDLTQGPLGRQILRFSVPLIFTNLLQVLFNMADVAVVGKFAGSLALGAVGSTSTLVTLFTGFLIGMGSGVNVLAALYFGAKKPRQLSDTIHTAAILCAVAGVALLAIGVGFARSVLELLNTKPELIDGAVLYLRIYFLGMPALAIYNFGNGVFSAVGDTKRPLVYLSVAGAVNIALNLFFVIVCNLDVAGVAIASIVSQYISAILVVAALLRGRTVYSLRLGRLRIHPSRAKAILQIGLPAGLQGSVFALANLFTQMGVNSFSAVMVAGNSAAANADTLIFDVMAAFHTACASFIGQNYGARKKDRIRKSYLISLGYSFGIGTVMGLSLVIFGNQFLGLFTSDPEVVAMGMKRLVIMGSCYGVSAFMDCTISASRGLGKSLAPTVIVILGSCVFRVAWIYTVFAHFRTIPSLYLLYVCSWTISAIGEIAYFVHTYKKDLADL